MHKQSPHGSGPLDDVYLQGLRFFHTEVYRAMLLPSLSLSSHEHDPFLVLGSRKISRHVNNDWGIGAKWFGLGLSHENFDA